MFSLRLIQYKAEAFTGNLIILQSASNGGMEYTYEEEESSDADRELRPLARRTGKHIAAGEERPRINSSQQTTPIDESSKISMAILIYNGHFDNRFSTATPTSHKS
ncbi:unnamed protein product [Colias eurytheme]|nr:unnamed protein product [Colias eurytheme]